MKYYGGFLVSGLLSLKGSLLAIKIFNILLCKLLYVFVCQINVLKLNWIEIEILLGYMYTVCKVFFKEVLVTNIFIFHRNVHSCWP